jgi:hypothetical protein
MFHFEGPSEIWGKAYQLFYPTPEPYLFLRLFYSSIFLTLLYFQIKEARTVSDIYIQRKYKINKTFSCNFLLILVSTL